MVLLGLPALAASDAPAAAADDGAAADLSELSDTAIQARLGRWESLSVDDRRALLTEIHKRMVEAGKEPIVRIRTERRFGYRIERPDGSVVEVHKREGIVRYRMLDPDRPFGVGFERRFDEPGAAPAGGAAPAAAADGEASRGTDAAAAARERIREIRVEPARP